MSVSPETANNLNSLKDKIASLIFEYPDKDLLTIYNYFSESRNKGKDKSLNLITRYIYYDLQVSEKFNNSENISGDLISKIFHSKLKDKAYSKYDEFNKIKNDYRSLGANFPEFEISPDVFWKLGVKEIITFIDSNHDDGPI